MEIVEFVEKVYNVQLMEYQKEFLIMAYEARKNEQELIYIPPRCNNRFSFSILSALAIVFDAQMKGILKPSFYRSYECRTEENVEQD